MINSHDIEDMKPEPARQECVYCESDNKAIRETFFDQNCHVCVKRMVTGSTA
jgi:hypothetical protein